MGFMLICLDGVKASAEYGCLGLLSALFARQSDPEELKRMLVDDFGLILTEEIDGEVDAMCNFSEGVWEDGKETGIEIGKEDGKKAGIEIGKEGGKEAGIEIGKEAGVKAGIEIGKAESLRSLMQSMPTDLEGAMCLLGLSLDERPKYERLVKNAL